MGRHFSADDFFRKVIDEILENLLLFWRFGSFDNYPQKNSKISSKKMKKSCFGSAIFLSKCSSLDLQWGQMGRGFSADDFFCQKSSLLRRSVWHNSTELYAEKHSTVMGEENQFDIKIICMLKNDGRIEEKR